MRLADNLRTTSDETTHVACAAVGDARQDDGTRSTPSRSTSIDSDEALVRRLKIGETDAFDELVRLHGPRMLLVIRRFLPRECDAEDALQDAFINVFRSISAFESESRLSTWLHRVAANAALMRIRSKRRRPEKLVDESSFDSLPASAADGPSIGGVDAASGGIDRHELVHRSIAELPDEARTVVLLRDLNGMELPEICRLLDVGMSTVKSRLRRGRSSLRATLQSKLGMVTS